MEGSIIELPGLPEVPRVVYERTPLVLALCQLKFSQVMGAADPAYVAPFQRALRRQYPRAGEQRQVDVQINVDSGEPDVRSTRRPHTWRFTDPQDDWTVVLGQEFVSLETRAYAHFGEFLDRLRAVLEALTEHIQPDLGTRLGLRYINEIRLDGLTAGQAIRRELLGPLAVPPFEADVHRALQQLTLRYPGNQGINVHHGRLPGGSTVAPRAGAAPSQQPFYLLDFDVFCEFPPLSPLPIEPDAICRYVERYHQLIYRLFRWSVTDEYLATLGVRRNDPD